MSPNRHRNFANWLARVALLVWLSAAVSRAVPPAAPTNLVGVSKSSTGTVDFTWEDNSDDEAGFVLEIFLDGVWTNFFGTIDPDTVFFSVNGPHSTPPGNSWRVRAVNAADEFSESSNEVLAFTYSATLSVTGFHRCQIGDPVNFPVTLTGDFTDPTFEVGPLPQGVTFDAGTRVISGAPTEGGFFAVSIVAKDGVNQRKCSIGLAVIDPPTVVAIPPAPVGESGTSQDIDLNTVFDDPDTESTAVIKTNLGDVPLTLFDTTAPLHSDNFKGYMERDDWDNTIIHRSINNFVLQGGWLTPDPDNEATFTTTPSAGFVPDEYDESRPNTGSTFAMAKNNPGEASTNWFISMKDNAQNLDFQAGGFAAFARVIGDGMTVLETIEALQTGTYSVTLNGNAQNVTDLPLTAITPESPLNSQLVIVSSIEPIAPLTFEVVSNSNPSAVTATLVDSVLTLGFTGTGGESEITVAATDLDGARTETTFTATSNATYASWAAATGAGAASENDDGGILRNSQEYAFGGAPANAVDDADRAPVFGEFEQEGESYDTITFYHRKFTADAGYTVQSSIDLGNWIDVWTTADTTGAAQVVSVEEEGDFWKVTVKAPEPQSVGGQRFFFRVKVVVAVP